MALQAGVLPVETGFNVCEVLIHVCLGPGSHLLNQIRSRVEATIHFRLRRVKAAVHFLLRRVKATTGLLVRHKTSVSQSAG